ncbi:MAG: LpxI family protein [Alphaproteobacteria bacterium]
MVKKAIIAGGGELPRIIVDSLKEQNIPYYIIAIKGEYNLSFPEPDSIIDIGLVKSILEIFEKESIKEVILAGSIKRPAFSSLKIDSEGLKLIAQITKNTILGDNKLLSTIVKFIENKGYRVIGADEIVAKILTDQGILGEIFPSNEDKEDIELGKKVAQAIGQMDIGQGVIIENGLVLGIEAIEGTDELIKRCALLKRESFKKGILVKMKKPNQEQKADLPTIGVTTVRNIAQAGFKGIAIEAGNSFILNKEEVLKEANNKGIFVVGI